MSPEEQTATDFGEASVDVSPSPSHVLPPIASTDDVQERLEEQSRTEWAPPVSWDDNKVTACRASKPPVPASLRPKLVAAWRRALKLGIPSGEASGDGTVTDVTDDDSSASLPSSLGLSPIQRVLFDPLFGHFDTFHLASQWQEQTDYRQLYCLHVLNEVEAVRARILRNHERLVQFPELECRDQGFTRPRTLIIVPFRNGALEIVRTLGALWLALGDGYQVDNQTRLVGEFGPSEEDVASDQRRAATNQPDGFRHTFRENTDDCFRMGIKCTRKTMKLFTDFYSSDIIIGSPLGLRMVIDGQEERLKMPVVVAGGKRTRKKRIVRKGDYDHLSSIQTLIIDQADVIGMQNWEHLVHVMEHLNRLPRGIHDCDFSRVQIHFLDGLGGATRQTVLFSEYITPEINALLKGLRPAHGQWKLFVGQHPGILKRVIRMHPQLTPQVHLIESPSLQTLPATRFTYFQERLLSLYSQSSSHVCIFIPSYLDFVQVREYFQRAELSHVILSEYCQASEISGARAKFFAGQGRFLLVTERFHFFKRYRIRGIRQLIFYALPEHADYYEQWCGYVETTEEGKDQGREREQNSRVQIIVSPFDHLRAERIIGTRKWNSLLNPK